MRYLCDLLSVVLMVHTLAIRTHIPSRTADLDLFDSSTLADTAHPSPPFQTLSKAHMHGTPGLTHAPVRGQRQPRPVAKTACVLGLVVFYSRYYVDGRKTTQSLRIVILDIDLHHGMLSSINDDGVCSLE
ncbi:hypothetical protein EV363DRAFT_1188771 [Boletus edulis]|uniref:Uncharacterized protein n=1 Tax=Boletus edulis BED1 TaxID=1328754 RepID=A0AAD4BZ56_BOLED|nr:hypothetical protein EV363DRAFT_1188771 [Boletus edulis]KAF8443228.1 hypothetical protein L210DRAFT_3166483 [Boletus edulis BED1]